MKTFRNVAIKAIEAVIRVGIRKSDTVLIKLPITTSFLVNIYSNIIDRNLGAVQF